MINNSLEGWIKTISKCQTERELEAVRQVWAKVGNTFAQSNWSDIWNAINDKKLEIEGVDVSKPAF